MNAMALLLHPSRAIPTCFLRSLASSILCRPLLAPSNKLSVCRHLRTIMFLSSTASPGFMKPFASQPEITNPAMLISYRECCINSSQGKKLEFEYTKLPTRDFCMFMESESKSQIVAFFREIERELEGNRKLSDFHLKVVNCEGGFKVEVYYGVEKLGPPVSPPLGCISCYPNAPLFPGQEPMVEARECVLEEFSDHPNAVCRLDAKGRCGFIITPIRHVDRMSELHDEELFGLWSLAVRVLREVNLPFISMILNHGTYRNVEHLHLKVWVDKILFEQYRAQWGNERQELWRRLQYFASRRPRKGLRLKKL